MRKVKCKRCGKSEDIEKAYLHVHITKSGNKQNKYYCTKECYDVVQNDIYMLKQCQYFIDKILNYTVINNQKNKSLKEIVDAGYTREQVYYAMTKLEENIKSGLSYRSDIDGERNKILYIYSIIRNNIKEITDAKIKEDNLKKKTLKNNIIDLIDEDKYIPKKKNEQKKSLMQIIKGGNYE